MIPSCIYATISIIKYKFPKTRGGRRPFGIFLKIHPIWQRHPSLIVARYICHCPLRLISTVHFSSYVYYVELWNRILKSLIKVGCPISDFPILSAFFNSPCPCPCPCSCCHFKMRHTYVGPLVPEL